MKVASAHAAAMLLFFRDTGMTGYRDIDVGTEYRYDGMSGYRRLFRDVGMTAYRDIDVGTGCRDNGISV